MVGPKLFSPQSVAVVGASLRQSSAGHAVLRNLLKVGNACPPISASGIDADRLLPRRQTV
jgi:predicted CoA-binding protein